MTTLLIRFLGAVLTIAALCMSDDDKSGSDKGAQRTDVPVTVTRSATP